MNFTIIIRIKENIFNKGVKSTNLNLNFHKEVKKDRKCL